MVIYFKLKRRQVILARYDLRLNPNHLIISINNFSIKPCVFFFCITPNQVQVVMILNQLLSDHQVVFCLSMNDSRRKNLYE